MDTLSPVATIPFVDVNIQQDNEIDSGVWIIPVVIGSILCLLCSIILVVYFSKRKKKQEHEENVDCSEMTSAKSDYIDGKYGKIPSNEKECEYESMDNILKKTNNENEYGELQLKKKEQNQYDEFQRNKPNQYDEFQR